MSHTELSVVFNYDIYDKWFLTYTNGTTQTAYFADANHVSLVSTNVFYMEIGDLYPPLTSQSLGHASFRLLTVQPSSFGQAPFYPFNH
jgi:hypothetical protein